MRDSYFWETNMGGGMGGGRGGWGDWVMGPEGGT